MLKIGTYQTATMPKTLQRSIPRCSRVNRIRQSTGRDFLNHRSTALVDASVQPDQSRKLRNVVSSEFSDCVLKIFETNLLNFQDFLTLRSP